MKTIVIMRHAKADKTGRFEDIYRPLTEQGQKDALKVARKLKKRKFVPEHAICSPAVRTIQTAKIVLDELDFDKQIYFDKNLYFGSYDIFSELIYTLPIGIENFIYFGHNPTCEEIVYNLTKQNLSMGTSTAVQMVFDIDEWPEVLKNEPIEFEIFEK